MASHTCDKPFLASATSYQMTPKKQHRAAEKIRGASVLTACVEKSCLGHLGSLEGHRRLKMSKEDADLDTGFL